MSCFKCGLCLSAITFLLHRYYILPHELWLIRWNVNADVYCMLFLSLTQHYIIYLIIFCQWGTKNAKKKRKKRNYNKNTAVNSVHPPENTFSFEPRAPTCVCVCVSRKQSSVHDRIFTLQFYLLSPAGSSGAFKGCKSNCFLHFHEHKYRGEPGGKTHDTEAGNSTRNNGMLTRRSTHLSKEEQLIILSPFDSYLCVVAAQAGKIMLYFNKII